MESKEPLNSVSEQGLITGVALALLIVLSLAAVLSIVL